MASVNRITLVGNVGADPEIRYMPDGKPTATVRLATTDKWKDKATGEMREATEWHRVVFFGKLAEIVGEYVTKGQQLYVEGKNKTRKWTDSNGVDRYTTEVVGREMQMLGKKGDNAGKTPAAPQDDTPPATAWDEEDDRIPF